MKASSPLLLCALLLVNSATSANPSTTATAATQTSTPTAPTTEPLSSPSGAPNSPTPDPASPPSAGPNPPTPDPASPPSAGPNPPTPDPASPPSAGPNPPTPDPASPPSASPNPPTPDPASPPSAGPNPPTSDPASPPSAGPNPPTPDSASPPSAGPNPPTPGPSITISSAPTAPSTAPSVDTTNSSITIAPTSVSNVSAVTSSSTNTGSSNLCQANSCGGDAVCVQLFRTHFCLCAEDYYYSSPRCLKGKTFPGTIEVNVPETTGLMIESSQAYEDLYNEITTFFKEAFIGTDYGQTVILKVSIPASVSARSETRAGNKAVGASVVNIFHQNTTEDETTISNIILKAVSQNSSILNYTGRDMCDYYGCKKNDQGNCNDGLQCECKEGLQKPNPQSRFCYALECSEDCAAELKKQCLKKDNGKHECECLPGYKKDANKNCQKCPFGYSGMECQDKFQLILTIVGTIAGILLLSLLIGLIVSASSKNRKKNIEEQNLIEDDFQSLRLQQTGFSNPAASGIVFPKVRTTSSRDSQAQNPYTQNPYAQQRSAPRRDY